MACSAARRLRMVFPLSLFVLGIDAAWTAHQPSGVALVRVTRKTKPCLVAVARSYAEFIQSEKLRAPAWQTHVSGAPPDIELLLLRRSGYQWLKNYFCGGGLLPTAIVPG
ncbi:MAG: hypothetical protein ACREOO_21880 [bacterium]